MAVDGDDLDPEEEEQDYANSLLHGPEGARYRNPWFYPPALMPGTLELTPNHYTLYAAFSGIEDIPFDLMVQQVPTIITSHFPHLTVKRLWRKSEYMDDIEFVKRKDFVVKPRPTLRSLEHFWGNLVIGEHAAGEEIVPGVNETARGISVHMNLPYVNSRQSAEFMKKLGKTYSIVALPESHNEVNIPDHNEMLMEWYERNRGNLPEGYFAHIKNFLENNPSFNRRTPWEAAKKAAYTLYTRLRK